MKFPKKRVLTIAIKVLIYLHLWHKDIKIYIQEFNIITIFTLINSFTYLFFNKKLNNFVRFIIPVLEEWLIQVKRLVAAPTVLILSPDYSDRGNEEISRYM